MKKIITMNPEEFVANSKGRFFLIVYSTANDTFFANEGGSVESATRGSGGSAVEREKAVEAYYAALSNVRSGMIPEGRLDIVELPLFSNE